MYSAQPIRNFNNLEQGAGRLNIEGAVRIAGWVRSDASSLANGASMLTAWDEFGSGQFYRKRKCALGPRSNHGLLRPLWQRADDEMASDVRPNKTVS